MERPAAYEPAANTRLLVSHTRRLPNRLKKLLKRRQVVEPMIGHMKADGLLDRNWLKGALGDAMHAILCGAGHNLRKILARLRRSLYGALISPLCRLWRRAILCLEPSLAWQAA